MNKRGSASHPGADHRHVAAIQLQAGPDTAGFTAFFEPEGNERFIKPGDHLTITFDTAEPQQIDIAMEKEGLVLWRPMRGDVRVSIVDRRTGEEITDLW